MAWTTRAGKGVATLNTRHPLAGRLRHGFVFTEGAGAPKNIKIPASSPSLVGAASWATNTTGPTVRTAGGYINSGTTEAFPQPPFHIVAGIRSPSHFAHDHNFIVTSVLDGIGYTAATWNVAFGWETPTGTWVVDGGAYYDNTTTGSLHNFTDDFFAVFVPDSVHHIHLACEPASTTMFRNGVQLTPTTAEMATAPVKPGTASLPLNFAGGNGEGYRFQADFEYLYIFNGTITAAERAALQADPYGLVDPDYAGPTRFYLPSTGTAAVSPAFDAAWNDVSAVVPRPTSATKGTSAFVEITDTETSTSSGWDVALGQFISAPLAAQTISGNALGYIRARENNAAANARSQMVIRVVSGDGLTIRGTLLAQSTDTTNVNEWVATTTPSAARNSRVPRLGYATTLTPVAVQQGDRLVIEVGGRAVNTASTSYALSMWFGENAVDLAANETGIVDGAPWIEFDSPILFYTESASHTVTGSVAAKKPNAASSATQTFPARSLTTSAAAKKPTAAATAGQPIPARSVTAAAVATKPTGAATLTTSALSTGAFSAGFSSGFGAPITAGVVSGIVAAAKPSVTATSTQTFPARSVVSTVVATKPTTTAAATQTSIARAVTAAAAAKKPTAAAAATQTFPARAVAGTAAASKPVAAATVKQVRRVSATASATKPTAVATAAQAQIGSASVTASAAAKKPSASASAAQVFPARSISGIAAAKKPTASAIASQPIQGQNAATAAGAPKPSASGTVVQSRRATASAEAPRPVATASSEQVFPPRFVSTAAAASKPTAQAFVDLILPASSVEGLILVAKPTATATAKQGPSPGAAHIANAVRLSGFIDMDVLIAGAIESDIALTGIIEE